MSAPHGLLDLEAVARPATAWMLTYALHSTLLLGAAWLLGRALGRRRLPLQETAWKSALVGGILTATLQLALVAAAPAVGLDGFEPWAGQWALAGPEVEANHDAAGVPSGGFGPAAGQPAVPPLQEASSSPRATSPLAGRTGAAPAIGTSAGGDSGRNAATTPGDRAGRNADERRSRPAAAPGRTAGGREGVAVGTAGRAVAVGASPPATSGPTPGAPSEASASTVAPSTPDRSRFAARWWPLAAVGTWAAVALFLLAALGSAYGLLAWRLRHRRRVEEGVMPALFGRLLDRAHRAPAAPGRPSAPSSGLLAPGAEAGHLAARRKIVSRRLSRVRLTTSTWLPVPIAWGLARPEVSVPERALHHLSPFHQESILAHELSHLLRRDPAWLAIARVIEALLFFQPLNRVARRQLQEIAELRCDDRAVELTGRPLELARCLTEVAAWRLAEGMAASLPVPTLPASGMSAAGSGLGERVRRLLDRPTGEAASRPVRRGARAAAWTVVAAVLALVALAAPGVRGQASGDVGEETPPPRIASPALPPPVPAGAAAEREEPRPAATAPPSGPSAAVGDRRPASSGSSDLDGDDPGNEAEAGAELASIGPTASPDTTGVEARVRTLVEPRRREAALGGRGAAARRLEALPDAAHPGEGPPLPRLESHRERLRFERLVEERSARTAVARTAAEVERLHARTEAQRTRTPESAENRRSRIEARGERAHADSERRRAEAAAQHDHLDAERLRRLEREARDHALGRAERDRAEVEIEARRIQSEKLRLLEREAHDRARAAAERRRAEAAETRSHRLDADDLRQLEREARDRALTRAERHRAEIERQSSRLEREARHRALAEAERRRAEVAAEQDHLDAEGLRRLEREARDHALGRAERDRAEVEAERAHHPDAEELRRLEREAHDRALADAERARARVAGAEAAAARDREHLERRAEHHALRAQEAARAAEADVLPHLRQALAAERAALEAERAQAARGDDSEAEAEERRALEAEIARLRADLEATAAGLHRAAEEALAEGDLELAERLAADADHLAAQAGRVEQELRAAHDRRSDHRARALAERQRALEHLEAEIAAREREARRSAEGENDPGSSTPEAPSPEAPPAATGRPPR